MAGRQAAENRRAPLSSTTALIGSTIRRLQVETTLLVVILLVVFTISLIMTALPRLYNEMSDDGLVYDVENATTFARNLNALINTRIPPGGSQDTFAPIEQTGRDFLTGLPQSMQDIVFDSNWVFDSPRYTVTDVPGTPMFPSERFMRMRYQLDIDPNISYVEGESPVPREPIAPPCVGDCPETDDLWELFEVAISTETAGQIGLEVGDQVILTPDRTDPQHRGRDFQALSYSIVLEVSGIFQPVDPDNPYWFEDSRLQRADEFETPDFVIYYATSLIAEEDYQRLLNLSETSTWAYEFRYYVDPDRFNVGELPELADDVRSSEFTYSAPSSAFATDRFVLRTGLTGLFNRFLDKQQQAVSVLSLAAIGMLAVAFSVVGLLAALIIERRRPTIALLRGRGASARQLITSQIAEGLAVAVPVVLLGYVAAVLLVDARASSWSIAAAVGAVIATTLILVLASLRYFRAPLREVEENQPPGRRASVRRVVVEVTIVTMAVAGVILLRRRGISPESAVGEGAGFDPYLAAVPILLGLATGLAALRLYPIPVRAIAWLGSLRRDLVLFVGLRRVSGQAAALRLPLLVILLAVALAVFSTVIQRSIDEGQVEYSWQSVGADYRIDPPLPGATLSSTIDVSGVEGIEHVTPGFVTTTNQLIGSGGRERGSVRLLLLDPPEYQDVAGDTLADPEFPEVMLTEQNITDIGTSANPIPVIISEQWPLAPAPGAGDTFVLSLRSLEITFVVRDVRDRFYGIPEDGPFIVAPYQSVSDVNPRIQFRPTMLLISGGSDLQEPLQATLDEQSPFSQLVSREALYASVSDAPLNSGVAVGFWLSVVLATICASLAAILALALTSRARARDLAYMRTMGLSPNQALLLTTIEQLPPVIVAGVVGSVLGAITALLVEPGIELSAFTGGGSTAQLLLDWVAISVVGLLVVGIVLAAIVAFGLASRSANLGQVLRLGDR